MVDVRPATFSTYHYSYLCGGLLLRTKFPSTFIVTTLILTVSVSLLVLLFVFKRWDFDIFVTLRSLLTFACKSLHFIFNHYLHNTMQRNHCCLWQNGKYLKPRPRGLNCYLWKTCQMGNRKQIRGLNFWK